MNSRLIFFRVAGYLKYISVSLHRKGHGIHSPFVFDIVNRVFRNKTDPAVDFAIEKIRRRLLKDRKVIDVEDFGAGAGIRVPEVCQRKVSDIARYSAVPAKYGRLLANLASEFGGELIIEFGTSLGISTMYIASSCKSASVYSMEGSAAIAEIAEENFREANLVNVKIIRGEFSNSLPDLIDMGIIPGLVFIDGNHRKKPLLEYFEEIVKMSGNNTVIVIDDINYSREMAEAWKEIRNSEKVTLTIDIFRMGIVFFRKGISGRNYIVRY